MHSSANKELAGFYYALQRLRAIEGTAVRNVNRLFALPSFCFPLYSFQTALRSGTNKLIVFQNPLVISAGSGRWRAKKNKHSFWGIKKSPRFVCTHKCPSLPSFFLPRFLSFLCRTSFYCYRLVCFVCVCGSWIDAMHEHETTLPTNRTAIISGKPFTCVHFTWTR